VHKYIRNNCSDVDICIFDLVWCANYVKDAPVQAIRVFDMTDAISKIYRENYNNARSFLKKFYYLNESKKLHKYEIISIRNSDVTFLLNNAEVEYFKEYGNVVLLSHGVSDSILNYSKYDAQYSNAVAFIGNMSYKPNIEAAIWYAQNVHIHLCSEYPFIIVGASPTKEILDLQIRYKNIIVTGYLDDPFVILKSAKVVVAPIRSGSGIQNKVLQSMALEKCVVLSTLAASPIVGGINRVNFIVADSVDEYIDAIRNIDVYNRNNKIGLAAKQIISSKYSWGNYTKVYFSEIHKMKKYGV
jgi:glycosyltransferase involved in cell wall biosynthesis